MRRVIKESGTFGAMKHFNLRSVKIRQQPDHVLHVSALILLCPMNANGGIKGINQPQPGC